MLHIWNTDVCKFCLPLYHPFRYNTSICKLCSIISKDLREMIVYKELVYISFFSICLFGPRVLILIVWPKQNVQTSTAVKNSGIHHAERSEKSISETEKK